MEEESKKTLTPKPETNHSPKPPEKDASNEKKNEKKKRKKKNKKKKKESKKKLKVDDNDSKNEISQNKSYFEVFGKDV